MAVLAKSHGLPRVQDLGHFVMDVGTYADPVLPNLAISTFKTNTVTINRPELVPKVGTP